MNAIKKFPYTDILGWSVSRYDKFTNCKRQYFYDYYAKYDKEIPFEKIQFLKFLTSKALEAGNITHDIIRDMLERFKKSSKPINKDKFFKYAFDMTQKYCSSKVFFESYYGNEIISPSEIYAKIKIMLENFIESERFKWIEKYAVAQSAFWIIEPEGFGETRINAYKAFCKVDFLFPVDDKIYILDWKTGKPDETKHNKQLTGYSLWANYHFEKPASDISPAIVYLFPDYSEKRVQIDAKKISDFALNVENETKEMYSYLTDINKNVPKDKKEFPFAERSFFCKYCSYKEICAGR
ncbi:MAG: PD-(D/E)XK nuclease family protein [Endomicrobium sp.]|jgi:CRISPR/Cas system-associated exonuclease Cas4 (RecB family)|nr:PD-(D/E)XK nuclease family protein [Endomicrobium sp.]